MVRAEGGGWRDGRGKENGVRVIRDGGRRAKLHAEE